MLSHPSLPPPPLPLLHSTTKFTSKLSNKILPHFHYLPPFFAVQFISLNILVRSHVRQSSTKPTFVPLLSNFPLFSFQLSSIRQVSSDGFRMPRLWCMVLGKMAKHGYLHVVEFAFTKRRKYHNPQKGPKHCYLRCCFPFSHFHKFGKPYKLRTSANVNFKRQKSLYVIYNVAYLISRNTALSRHVLKFPKSCPAKTMVKSGSFSPCRWETEGKTNGNTRRNRVANRVLVFLFLLCSSLETPALPAAKLQRFHPHVWSTLQSLSYVATPRAMFSKTGKTGKPGKTGKTCQTFQNRPSQICTGLSPTSLTLSRLSIGNLSLSTLFLSLFLSVRLKPSNQISIKCSIIKPTSTRSNVSLSNLFLANLYP